jgi:hypothetical protein
MVFRRDMTEGRLANPLALQLCGASMLRAMFPMRSHQHLQQEHDTSALSVLLPSAYERKHRAHYKKQLTSEEAFEAERAIMPLSIKACLL